ncbi:MAG: hypothetical protein MI757_12590, partial [Pirellulales bacterium]|nr:hypothetical protein [Pirellulales bacterium]
AQRRTKRFTQPPSVFNLHVYSTCLRCFRQSGVSGHLHLRRSLHVTQSYDFISHVELLEAILSGDADLAEAKAKLAAGPQREFIDHLRARYGDEPISTQSESTDLSQVFQAIDANTSH